MDQHDLTCATARGNAIKDRQLAAIQPKVPKSLHTVRILINIARLGNHPALPDPADRVLWAASVCGYPNASIHDDVIERAISGLIRERAKEAA